MFCLFSPYINCKGPPSLYPHCINIAKGRHPAAKVARENINAKDQTNNVKTHVNHIVKLEQKLVV